MKLMPHTFYFIALTIGLLFSSYLNALTIEVITPPSTTKWESFYIEAFDSNNQRLFREKITSPQTSATLNKSIPENTSFYLKYTIQFPGQIIPLYSRSCYKANINQLQVDISATDRVQPNCN